MSRFVFDRTGVQREDGSPLYSSCCPKRMGQNSRFLREAYEQGRQDARQDFAELVEAAEAIYKTIEEGNVRDRMANDGDGRFDVWRSEGFESEIAALAAALAKLDKSDTK